MNASVRPVPRALQSKPRRVHLVLRDGAEIEGGIFLNDGQALAPYLGTRKGGWVNLIGAQWLVPVEDAVSHAVLQADQVLYAYGVEGDVPVHSVQAALVSPRAIEVTLTSGARIFGDLAIANRQRLSDFLHTAGKFIPIVSARRSDTGESVGDIALNHSAVRVLRDSGAASRSTMETELAREGTPHAGIAVLGRSEARIPTPLDAIAALARPVAAATPRVASLSPTRGPIQSALIASVEDAQRDMVPPTRIDRREPSRPSMRLNLDDDSRPLVEEIEVDGSATQYSPAVEAVAARASAHWLSRVAERFGLAPADPRRLSAEHTSADLWAGISRANDLSVDELALHVATTFSFRLRDSTRFLRRRLDCLE